VSELTFLIGNPRTHDAANLTAIKGSLAQFGQLEPLVVNRQPRRDQVIREYEDNPAAQDTLALRCLDEIQSALQQEKEQLRDRLGKTVEELALRRD
jgi:hypothetical protein